jgi:hypothetical protein
LAFTSDYGTAPPDEITALFDDIKKLPPSEARVLAIQDVCLGFCYDPVTAFLASR